MSSDLVFPFSYTESKRCLVQLVSNYYDVSLSHFLTISTAVIKFLAMWRVGRVIFSRIISDFDFSLVDFFFSFKPVSF